MATTPFSAEFQARLKEDVQGGTLSMVKGLVVTPRWFCCISGTSVGVAKDPVALLVVNPLQVCPCQAVTADYSLSWSPSSTIATWSVDWGDGNVSNGAWPGAGSVAHPGACGGYDLPGIYTVTLTVTDLLGAIGIAEQQIEVLDCDGILMDVFAGCGSSGVWRTFNAGGHWSPVGGGVLDGVEIYDLKASPFTLEANAIELVAATAIGLYRSEDSGNSWGLLEPPIGSMGTKTPTVVSVCFSPIDPKEFYVLGYQVTPSYVWLYRTTDSGETWTNRRLGSLASVMEWGFAPSEPPNAHGYATYNNNLYGMPIHAATGMSSVGVRDSTTQTWGGAGVCPVTRGRSLGVSGGYLWCAGYNIVPVMRQQEALARYNGIAWQLYTDDIDSLYNDMVVLNNGTICCSAANHVDFWNALGVKTGTTPNVSGGIYHLGKLGNTLLAYGYDAGANRRVWRWVSPVWVEEDFDSGWPNVNGFMQEFEGKVYLALQNPPYIVRRVGTHWLPDVNQPDAAFQGLNVSEEELLGARAVSGKAIFTYAGGGWRRIASVPIGLPTTAVYDDLVLLYSSGNAVYRIDNAGSASVPMAGRFHLLSMSLDGSYVFAVCLDNSNEPIVFLCPYDLSAAFTIYEPGAGTWGGVQCGHYDPARVWLFGDFGAATKVLLSENYGSTMMNVTEGAWAANELVRPILLSVYDSGDAIAVLNTALDTWRTQDFGSSWVKTGDTVFSCHCGARDFWDDFMIFIGRLAVGANHLQFSVNLGDDWGERSDGITANCPITAIQIVG